jgi:large subunit ribosomal protein L6
MSRIGKKPIEVPAKTTVDIKDGVVTVKGEKGSLSKAIHPACALKLEENVLQVEIVSKDRKAHAFQGLMRALIANMVTGVSKGFERKLEINGIGYRAELKGKTVILNVGYSNPAEYALPEGINAKVDKTTITLEGIDKELLGRTAAEIRMIRPPEPYKGKGIKYAEEYIQKKAGKTGTK